MRAQEPFQHPLPDVAPGMLVHCATGDGQYVRKVAMSGPRYDHTNAVGRTVWMTVAVASIEDFERDGDQADWVNWPAEHVHPDSATQEANHA